MELTFEEWKNLYSVLDEFDLRNDELLALQIKIGRFIMSVPGGREWITAKHKFDNIEMMYPELTQNKGE